MSRWRAWAREPLLHFLLIGGALFLGFELTRDDSAAAPDRIEVTPGQVEGLRAQFQRTWMRPPNDEEVEGLIREFVREEVYTREALALGLDRDDTLIRRRLRQKLEFILEDFAPAEAPDDSVLVAFLAENADRFRSDPRATVEQVYLSPDAHDDLDAEAERVLGRLLEGADPGTVGDATLLPAALRAATPRDLANSFGPAFAEDVFASEETGWHGPIDSSLGRHLVRITERVEGRLPELAEVRDRVEREWASVRRRELREAAYERLLENYEVVIEEVSVEETDPEGDSDAESAPDGEGDAPGGAGG